MEDETFIGKDKCFRRFQEKTIEAILREDHVEKDDTFKSIWRLVAIIGARGDVVPPRTITLPSSIKSDNSPCLEDETNILPYETNIYDLFSEGKVVVQEINDSLKRARIEHEEIKMISPGWGSLMPKQMKQQKEEALWKIQELNTMASIVRLWLRVLEERKWDACKEMRNYQLDVLDKALKAARDSRPNVRQALVYLVQYFSMTVEWPSESCNTNEFEDLKTIARIISHKS